MVRVSKQEELPELAHHVDMKFSDLVRVVIKTKVIVV